ncbi:MULTISPECIES: CPBP family intramembrane glutamic endopeptidase [Ramlibacter]|uniref:CPBP family intramembrane metalloprotease n=1 Tax=Ramlibacter aquaticus TaxID=2780094 RepID=A0ABR9SGE1_9BURK|nr:MULTISPECIES: CPBP family intramembrane glutamic endopeptidase [Ramlibacter]MBE7941427.1 CPBP family intramembrane metalloprotease [Ramlibacter aquaticus]
MFKFKSSSSICGLLILALSLPLILTVGLGQLGLTQTSYVVFLAFTEEIIFRFGLFRIALKWLRLPVAVLASAIVFAASHLPTAGLPMYLLEGVTLAMVYFITGSLLVCCSLHSAHNLIVIALTHKQWAWEYHELVVPAATLLGIWGLVKIVIFCLMFLPVVRRDAKGWEWVGTQPANSG